MSPFEERERRLLSEKRAPMPEHAGEARYQASLDRDRAYREMILMALAIATIVSTGFGKMPGYVGPLQGALLCLASGGFAIRATYLRFPRTSESRSWSYGPSASVAAVSLAVFAVLGSVLAGLIGLFTIALLVGAIGVGLLASEQPVFRVPLYLLGGIGLTGGTIWSLGTSSGTVSTTAMAIAAPIGLAMGVFAVFGNLDEPFEIQPMLALTSLASFGWLVSAVPAVVAQPYDAIVVAGGGLVGGLAMRWASARGSFAPVVLAAILIQLAGYVGVGSLVPRALAPQAVAMLIEFTLLGAAGYRQAVAALARFPLATYRSSPQCLVSAQDHAWDHPVRIDAG